MSAIVDKIEYGRPDIDGPGDMIDIKVTFVIRYSDSSENWTEISLIVHLPKKDYTISELKSAALQKARNSLILLHQADYAVSPGSGDS